MRIRTGLYIGVAAAFAALLVYLASQPNGSIEPGRVAAEAVEPAVPHDLESGITHLYCTERIGPSVVINTGPDCAAKTDAAGAAAGSVTITHEAGALVITGADP